jgi:4-hydroxybenzoate polyprenyltransferase
MLSSRTVDRSVNAGSFRTGARTLRMCLIEARPTVLVVFLLRYLVGCAFGAGPGVLAGLPRMAGGALVCQLAVCAIYLFNGVMDVDEDRINGSGRPIARGDLGTDTALSVAGSAAGLAIAGALAFGATMSLLVAVMLLVGYLYSGPPLFLKRRSSGTILVVGIIGLLTYAAGLVASAGADVPRQRVLSLAVIAVAASLWMGLVGGPAKDLPDIPGDIAAGRRTLATVRGERLVRFVMAGAAVVLAVGFGAVVLTLGLPLSGPAVTMLAGAIVISVLSLGALSAGSRARRRRPYRAFMLTQYGLNLSALLLHF